MTFVHTTHLAYILKHRNYWHDLVKVKNRIFFCGIYFRLTEKIIGSKESLNPTFFGSKFINSLFGISNFVTTSPGMIFPRLLCIHWWSSKKLIFKDFRIWYFPIAAINFTVPLFFLLYRLLFSQKEELIWVTRQYVGHMPLFD